MALRLPDVVPFADPSVKRLTDPNDLRNLALVRGDNVLDVEHFTDAIHCYVLDLDGEPVSSALLIPSLHDTAVIEHVLTLPAYRRRGYGRWLLRALHAEAARMGMRQVVPRLERGRSPALRRARLHRDLPHRCLPRRRVTRFHDEGGRTLEGSGRSFALRSSLASQRKEPTNDDRTTHDPRPARHRAHLQGLAAGSRPAHADEQPRPRGGRAPGGPRRLRRHRQGGAQLGALRRHRREPARARRTTRRCWCSPASRSASSAPTPTRRAC